MTTGRAAGELCAITVRAVFAGAAGRGRYGSP